MCPGKLFTHMFQDHLEYLRTPHLSALGTLLSVTLCPVAAISAFFKGCLGFWSYLGCLCRGSEPWEFLFLSALVPLRQPETLWRV